MSYTVREIYYTLQGEGAQSGRPAVLLRFAGCNLWSGRERDRHGAVCSFCDTVFVGIDGPGGGRFPSPELLADAVASCWPTDEADGRQPYVVCTGGEPLLQLDPPAIRALHERNFEIGVETNGTIAAPNGIDWLCVSPKGRAALKQRSGHELKLIYPQEEPEAAPERFVELDFQHFYLQPLDPSFGNETDDQRLSVEGMQLTQQTVEYCLSHPRWKLSLQTHKVLGIP